VSIDAEFVSIVFSLFGLATATPRADRAAGGCYRMPSTVPTKDEPEVLDADMKVADLVEVLERLPFARERRCLVSLDRGVRDYLLRAIKPHGK
jgi:hypothetical protein